MRHRMSLSSGTQADMPAHTPLHEARVQPPSCSTLFPGGVRAALLAAAAPSVKVARVADQGPNSLHEGRVLLFQPPQVLLAAVLPHQLAHLLRNPERCVCLASMMP